VLNFLTIRVTKIGSPAELPSCRRRKVACYDTDFVCTHSQKKVRGIEIIRNQDPLELQFRSSEGRLSVPRSIKRSVEFIYVKVLTMRYAGPPVSWDP
jgi:hypothetical protein